MKFSRKKIRAMRAAHEHFMALLARVAFEQETIEMVGQMALDNTAAA